MNVPFPSENPHGEYIIDPSAEDAWYMLTGAKFVEWARERQPPKPVLPRAGMRLFNDLAAYARQNCRRLASLPHAASDYMDGRCLSEDAAVKELVAAGVLEEVKIEEPADRWSRDQEVTWHLSPYACAVLVAYASPGLPEKFA